MEILLSHHYWRDNKNAVWNPGLFPYPQIEQELKGSYAILESERPAWRKYGDITVFFDYRPGKDAYGRDIVPISLAFVPGCVEPGACRSVIAPALARAANNILKLNLELPTGSCQPAESPRPRSQLKSIILAAILVILFAGYLALKGERKPASEATPGPGAEISVSVRDSAPFGTDRHAPAEPQIPPEAAEQEVHAEIGTQARPEANAEDARYPSSAARIQDLCGDERIAASLYRCPRAYFISRCEGKISGKASFAKWLKSEAGKECAGFRGGQFFKPDLDADIQRRLKRFFTHGR